MGTLTFTCTYIEGNKNKPAFAATKNWQTQVDALYREPGLLATAQALARRAAGIPQQDAEDLCHDAFFIFSKCLLNGRYNGRSTLRTYYLAIVKWQAIMFSRSRRNKFTAWTPDLDNLPADDFELELLSKERDALLEIALDHIGVRPKQILKLAMQERPMLEIAATMGYKNAFVAKKMAFLSRLKLKAFIREEPELMAVLRA